MISALYKRQLFFYNNIISIKYIWRPKDYKAPYHEKGANNRFTCPSYNWLCRKSTPSSAFNFHFKAQKTNCTKHIPFTNKWLLKTDCPVNLTRDLGLHVRGNYLDCLLAIGHQARFPVLCGVAVRWGLGIHQLWGAMHGGGIDVAWGSCHCLLRALSHQN